MHTLVCWTPEKSLVGPPGTKLQPTSGNEHHSFCMAQDSKDLLSPPQLVVHLCPDL